MTILLKGDRGEHTESATDTPHTLHDHVPYPGMILSLSTLISQGSSEGSPMLLDNQFARVRVAA